MKSPLIPFTTHTVETDTGARFELQDCASTAASAFAWVPKVHELAVLFKSDDRVLYVYENVPETAYVGLQSAPSKGRFITQEIIRNYPFRKEIIK